VYRQGKIGILDSDPGGYRVSTPWSEKKMFKLGFYVVSEKYVPWWIFSPVWGKPFRFLAQMGPNYLY